ncbi:MAG: NAD(P)-binding domain-containing protein, partial [Actinomycetota bacterium]|nr:NAD(P)-binding domain-containing protein [Actinomycetota bacterium]
GFVGLGAMGRPMARRLLGAGFCVQVHNRSREPVDELVGQGATGADSPAGAADGAAAVFTMLPDAPVVRQVVTGSGGVLEGMAPGAVLVDTSSIDPGEAVKLAEAVADRRAHMLDAPVSGGVKGAADGDLSIMVGGDGDVVEHCRPALDVLARQVVHVGPSGSGQVCKLCNQMVVGVTIQAVAEALTVASKAGVDPATVRRALLGGFAASTVLEAHGQRMLERDFAPGGRASLHRKDLDAALALARSLATPVPATALVHQQFVALEGRGEGDADHAALALLLE